MLSSLSGTERILFGLSEIVESEETSCGEGTETSFVPFVYNTDGLLSGKGCVYGSELTGTVTVGGIAKSGGVDRGSVYGGRSDDSNAGECSTDGGVLGLKSEL